MTLSPAHRNQFIFHVDARSKNASEEVTFFVKMSRTYACTWYPVICSSPIRSTAIVSSAQGARLECWQSHQFRRIRIGQLAQTPDCPGRQLKQETKPGNNQERYIHIIQEISKSFGVQLKKLFFVDKMFPLFSA